MSSSEGGDAGTGRMLTTPAGRRTGAVALVAYGIFLGWILMWPSAGPASSSVDHVIDLLNDIGVPTTFATGTRVEFVLNALMVAPVPILGAWAGIRWSWERWTAYAFLASATVELAQGLLLPNRSAHFADVAANTLGILLSSVIAGVFIQRRWI